MGGRLGIAAMVLVLGAAREAAAYETDQLSGRGRTAPDVSPRVDAYVNAALEQARVRTQKRMRPDWSDERVGRVLRRKVYRQFPFNFHAFGAPIEGWMTHQLSKEGYAVEHHGPGSGWQDHIYDEYPKMFGMCWLEDLPTPALVFTGAQVFAGTEIAPTFLCGEVRYGSDKWSHFFRLGYRYWTHADQGRDHAAAVHFGTRTERRGVGYVTSGAFSYADLAANYSGYLFFSSLYGTPDATFTRVDDELVLSRPFRSADWVEESWDEYLNPNVYRPHLARAMELHLARDHDEICAEYAAWKDVSGQPRAPLRPHAEYVDLSEAPPQGDPFALARRCAEPVR